MQLSSNIHKSQSQNKNLEKTIVLVDILCQDLNEHIWEFRSPFEGKICPLQVRSTGQRGNRILKTIWLKTCKFAAKGKE